MTIQRRFAILSAANIALALLVLGAMFLVSRAQRAESSEVEARFDSYLLADELRQSSDDLTRMARTHVATGEARYRAMYRRILAIRDGTAARPENYGRVYWDYLAASGEPLPPAAPGEALFDRMRAVGITDAEMALLRAAKAASDDLVAIEDAAMDIVEAHALDAPEVARARGSLFDHAYHEQKALIMKPIDDFLLAIDKRTKKEVLAERARESGFTRLALSIGLLTVLLAFSSMRYLRRSMVDPITELSAQARRVGRGDLSNRVQWTGETEISALGATFNDMVDRLAERTRELEEQRERAESLLLNILPAPVAERLKVSSDVIADSFREVTVLFADIVGFTEMSATVDSEELVRILDRVFSAFDEIAAEHGLEKIKTIGDCYMVACGLPEPTADHVTPMIEFALAILERLEEISQESGRALRVRVGINTGPVTAGVIGRQKFIYDLWGDAVNTASRMESHGEAGRVQVTGAVHERASGRYEFESRGTIDIKGKGEMETYFLVGRRPAVV